MAAFPISPVKPFVNQPRLEPRAVAPQVKPPAFGGLTMPRPNMAPALSTATRTTERTDKTTANSAKLDSAVQSRASNFKLLQSLRTSQQPSTGGSVMAPRLSPASTLSPTSNNAYADGNKNNSVSASPSSEESPYIDFSPQTPLRVYGHAGDDGARDDPNYNPERLSNSAFENTYNSFRAAIDNGGNIEMDLIYNRTSGEFYVNHDRRELLLSQGKFVDIVNGDPEDIAKVAIRFDEFLGWLKTNGNEDTKLIMELKGDAGIAAVEELRRELANAGRTNGDMVSSMNTENLDRVSRAERQHDGTTGHPDVNLDLAQVFGIFKTPTEEDILNAYEKNYDAVVANVNNWTPQAYNLAQSAGLETGGWHHEGISAETGNTLALDQNHDFMISDDVENAVYQIRERGQE